MWTWKQINISDWRKTIAGENKNICFISIIIRFVSFEKNLHALHQKYSSSVLIEEWTLKLNPQRERNISESESGWWRSSRAEKILNGKLVVFNFFVVLRKKIASRLWMVNYIDWFQLRKKREDTKLFVISNCTFWDSLSDRQSVSIICGNVIMCKTFDEQVNTNNG